MGKPEVRNKLYARLDGMGMDAHRSYGSGGDGDGATGTSPGTGELPGWLEARISKHGVPFYKYVLREADEPEDELCEYEKQTLANIAANRRKFEELGLL